MRISNLNKVIVAHLNVKYFPDKLDAIKIIIPSIIDMISSETKLDASYTASQFIIEGFSNPFRLDRNSNGRVFLYTLGKT